MFVDIFVLTGNGEDEKAGTIGWDGSNFSITPSSPNGGQLLASIIKGTKVSAGENLIDSASDPETWMRGLSATLKSAYLRAGKVSTQSTFTPR